MEQMFHILPPVQPLLGLAPEGLDHGEFGFPVPQHMGIDPHEIADLTDAEIHLVWYLLEFRCRSFHIKSRL